MSCAIIRCMRPPGTPEQLEARRRRAIEMLDAGESLLAVARAVNASVSSVHRWYQAYQLKGSKGLAPVPALGRPAKLSEVQRERLEELFQRGPPAAGYETELWTLRRVADLIESEFAVAYHPCHVWKLLRRWGGVGRSPNAAPGSATKEKSNAGVGGDGRI